MPYCAPLKCDECSSTPLGGGRGAAVARKAAAGGGKCGPGPRLLVAGGVTAVWRGEGRGAAGPRLATLTQNNDSNKLGNEG